MVLTSTPKYATVDKATGLWLAEAVHFYHPLKHHGWEIDFVSPKGGVTPIDPVSLAYEMPEEDKVYLTDVTFQGKLNNTLTPSQVNPDDYSVIYYAGGHGVIFDFLEN